MDTDIQVIEKWKRNKKEKEKTRKEIKYTSILSMDIDIGNRKMKKWVVLVGVVEPISILNKKILF